VHHGHLPSLTPEVIRRFSVNGVLTTELLDALRESLGQRSRGSGRHVVVVSGAEIAEMDEQIDKLNLFKYTPKRRLDLEAAEMKGGPTSNLEHKSLEVAMRWYKEFLSGERDFDLREKQPFSPEHVVEDDVMNAEIVDVDE
jgi:hypothetical protein